MCVWSSFVLCVILSLCVIFSLHGTWYHNYIMYICVIFLHIMCDLVFMKLWIFVWHPLCMELSAITPSFSLHHTHPTPLPIPTPALPTPHCAPPSQLPCPTYTYTPRLTSSLEQASLSISPALSTSKHTPNFDPGIYYELCVQAATPNEIFIKLLARRAKLVRARN